jgi:putative transposase
MPTATELRQERAKQIVALGNMISRFSKENYIVKSQSGNGEYHVTYQTLKNNWICNCPDFLFRGWTCKHIYAVLFSSNLRELVQKQTTLTLEPINVSQCQFCGSRSLKKFGIRRNKSGDIQRYLCEFCKRTFSVNIGFEKMKHNPQAITSAMQLYFSGESLRNTMKSLRLLGVQVSHVTVLNWIRKYIELMNNYAEKIKPNVSQVWRADEIYVKMKGNPSWVFALMDDETRYWIAQEVAKTKYTYDARALFAHGKEITKVQPVKLITDGSQVYIEAYEKEIKTIVPQSEHLREIRINGEVHNNKMESLNGNTIRQREKTMRGLKNENSSILKGMQIFHNFIRDHQGLKGKTPSEACGIEIKGENKWKTLIENASMFLAHQPKFNSEKLESYGN